MKTIHNVTYIDNYADAPEGARYILRHIYDDQTWRLEHYSKDGEYSSIVKEFPNSSWAREFHKMVKTCRHLSGPSTILWVEKPSLMESFDSELDELYKEFIFRPEMCTGDDDE